MFDEGTSQPKSPPQLLSSCARDHCSMEETHSSSRGVNRVATGTRQVCLVARPSG